MEGHRSEEGERVLRDHVICRATRSLLSTTSSELLLLSTLSLEGKACRKGWLGRRERAVTRGGLRAWFRVGLMGRRHPSLTRHGGSSKSAERCILWAAIMTWVEIRSSKVALTPLWWRSMRSADRYALERSIHSFRRLSLCEPERLWGLLAYGRTSVRSSLSYRLGRALTR